MCARPACSAHWDCATIGPGKRQEQPCAMRLGCCLGSGTQVETPREQIEHQKQSVQERERERGRELQLKRTSFRYPNCKDTR